MRSDLLDKFAKQFTGLRVEFVMSDQFLNLSKGEADIAIRLFPFADDALVTRKIADQPWATMPLTLTWSGMAELRVLMISTITA